MDMSSTFWSAYRQIFVSGKKYAVLFDIYGGPGSQLTEGTFRRTVDCNAYLGSDPELEYIAVTMDNRGTGIRGGYSVPWSPVSWESWRRKIKSRPLGSAENETMLM
ncbi:unnamed protein product [Tuber aestivum]|uniref:Uncharacterized protein n=1 Tax=Tuber aestivum TaxID=59557 RepID=A0A292PY49_9PEZI|nr:unnamed protein product [Tuber aestivum]